MPNCTSCAASRECNGLWAMHDPLCLWCGARIIQVIGKLAIPQAEATARRKVQLAHWLEFGHSESAIREAVKGPLAYAPEAVEKKTKG